MKIAKLKISDLELHKHAFLNPFQSDSQFLGLKSNLERNGQLDPIRVSNGMVYDGRHRMKALDELQEEYILAEINDSLTDDDIYRIVKSSEIRRHQTVLQRSISAWKDYQISMMSEDTKRSQGEFATEYGIGKNAIGDVNSLNRIRPDLIDSLWNGDMYNVGTISNPRYTDKLKTILSYFKKVESESYDNRTSRQSHDERDSLTSDDRHLINVEVSKFETAFEDCNILDEAIKVLYSRMKEREK
jgi:hypothetical protein